MQPVHGPYSDGRHSATRRVEKGFTLVELLVVIAIIGVLVALLLPAIQAGRESGRRMACSNNLRQIGVATQNYYHARRYFPVGADSKTWKAAPNNDWTFYRWSSLAHLAPFLEEGNAVHLLDMSVPLYGTNLAVTPQNTAGVALRVSLFLCPSDTQLTVSPQFGPTNYAACAGSGMGGGTPFDTDGIFYVNSRTRLQNVTDGASHTVIFSESNLGNVEGTPLQKDPQVDYKFLLSTPLTDVACNASTTYNVSNARGFAWVSGEYRCATYNHYYPPNSTTADCVASKLFGGVTQQYSAYGWRTARSRHPNGVNACFADGSVRFITDETNLAVWQGMSTRAGQEFTGDAN